MHIMRANVSNTAIPPRATKSIIVFVTILPADGTNIIDLTKCEISLPYDQSFLFKHGKSLPGCNYLSYQTYARVFIDLFYFA